MYLDNIVPNREEVASGRNDLGELPLGWITRTNTPNPIRYTADEKRKAPIRTNDVIDEQTAAALQHGMCPNNELEYPQTTE